MGMSKEAFLLVDALIAIAALILLITRLKVHPFIALILASVNIFGGFLVTQRMLAMYQKKKK